MAVDDMRYYETFFGIHVNDWGKTFGNFSNHHKLLVKEYISEACSTTDGSEASITNKFLYPHHIKKTYFIEGVIQGHITIVADRGTCTMTSYRVTVCKVHEDTVETELFSTGWIDVSDILGWDVVYEVGDEMVYPFWIDAWSKKELNSLEKIYVKVETNSCSCCSLWHSNDTTWEDLKITIPFKM